MNISGIPLWKLMMAAGFLLPAVITDIREKKIILIPCLCGILTGLVSGALSDGGFLSACLGLIPGALLIVLSVVLKGTIGTGDGIILAMIGSFVGFTRAVAVLFMALAVSMTVALILLAIKKVSGKTEFPFVPFLCIGYMIMAFI